VFGPPENLILSGFLFFLLLTLLGKTGRQRKFLTNFLEEKFLVDKHCSGVSGTMGGEELLIKKGYG
jgi:hypothetical protein